MAEEAQTYGSSGDGHILGDPVVSFARTWVPRWMIVGKRERSAVVSEDGVEDFAHIDGGASRCPLRELHFMAQLSTSVAHEDNRSFATEPGKATLGALRHVGCASQSDFRLVIEWQPPSEFKPRDETGSLRNTDAWEACKLLDARLTQPTKAAKLREQMCGQIARARAAHPTAELESKQFGIAERLAPVSQQPFARTSTRRQRRQRPTHAYLTPQTWPFGWTT